VTPAPQPSLVEVLGPLASRLRCLDCGGPVELASLAGKPAQPDLGPDGELSCTRCDRRYPLAGGTARMLSAELAGGSAEAEVKRRTGESFAYEWERFGVLRPEWRQNFADYLVPHSPEWLRSQTVLDVGAGSGRHSRQAADAGASVVAVDIGRTIDVARRNLPRDVLTVQADAEQLPFEPASFDFVMAIGVLHHLPDPERALFSIARFVRPGGRLHIYLYWVPERRWHRALLGGVGAARRATVRLPHPVLHGLSYPVAALLLALFVAPFRVLRRFEATRRVAEALPLKTYADYPFRVLVNDQFDRLSAPVENRYTRDEVLAFLRNLGLADVTVTAGRNAGWVGDGQARAAGTDS
jgi:SAM-dependent methyltransferase